MLTKQTLFLFLIALAGWFAILLQLYLILVNRTSPVFQTVMTFFSFFTILTNILVAICCTALITNKDYGACFFTRPTVLGGTVVYIVIVGIIYNVILRGLWHPAGLQRLADELLHVVIPLSFSLYWFIYVPKKELNWQTSFRWLIYPLCYFVYILLLGLYLKTYPYPFIDVNKIGYPFVLRNSLIVGLAFLLVSFAVVLIAKMQVGRRPV
ncbi:Pr6Pr family membrane protein [Pedobacter sp. BS3]|uniref:Pr6Pr family membrane protein n=1 Tax=Pedobacter sp. BS3 TaxID=2567937 RepID=UPI001F5B4A78|nr:Pr6Pr family membrane protein [Pedobacter sp. BS3]